MPLSKGKCDGVKPRQEDVESAAAQLNERNLVGNRSLIDLWRGEKIVCAASGGLIELFSWFRG